MVIIVCFVVTYVTGCTGFQSLSLSQRVAVTLCCSLLVAAQLV